MTGFLRRYTDVLSVIDIVRERRLTLLSPQAWPDRNDALGLELYRKITGAVAVYASCLTDAAETSHHWQIFSNHNHGVCVVFDKDKLTSAFDEADVKHGPMQYRTLKEIRETEGLDISSLPFLKRDTFKAEKEYRAISTNTLGLIAPTSVHVPIQIDCISKIVIGPTVPRPLGMTLKSVIREQSLSSELRVTFSALWNNRSWNNVMNTAFPSQEGPNLAAD